MAFTASYTAPCTIAIPLDWPCAVGRTRIASPWAMMFHSSSTSVSGTATLRVSTTEAPVTAGAAATTASTAHTPAAMGIRRVPAPHRRRDSRSGTVRFVMSVSLWVGS